MSGEPQLFALGREYAPDARDTNFMMAIELPTNTAIAKTKYWRISNILDQGPFPHCVGFAWHQFCKSAPIMTKNPPGPDTIYREAQKVDEWAGENYDGTSVRAGVKVLHKLGRIAEYRWAWDAATVRDYVLTRGTVVVGTAWYTDMFEPDSKTGFVKPTGRIAGGHAYVIAGYSVERKAFRIVNSWGADWGQKGRAWISFEDMDYLIKNQGEACSAIEIKI
jgi:hypothetical protein